MPGAFEATYQALQTRIAHLAALPLDALSQEEFKVRLHAIHAGA